MHKRPMLWVNAALAVAAVTLGWKLAVDWRQGAERSPLMSSAGDQRASYVLPGNAVAAGAGGEVVSRNPFSPDRSSVVEQAAVAVVPPGPLPVVIGTMKLGASYEALMAETGQAASSAFKRVSVGDSVGGHQVVEIRDDQVVVDLNGQRSTINVYQSASSVARSEARTLAPAQPAAPRVETSTAGSPNVASVPAGSSAGPVQLPSTEPGLKITLEGNRKRYERSTMFGPQIWFEDVK